MDTILVSDFSIDVYTFQSAINLPYKINYLYCENLIINFTRVYIVVAKFDKIGFIAPQNDLITECNRSELGDGLKRVQSCPPDQVLYLPTELEREERKVAR